MDQAGSSKAMLTYRPNQPTALLTIPLQSIISCSVSFSIREYYILFIEKFIVPMFIDTGVPPDCIYHSVNLSEAVNGIAIL